MKLSLTDLEKNFKKNRFNNEDDIKINFYSDIIKPLLKELNPNMLQDYSGENSLKYGGRTDATFQNILFELKELGRFDSESGIKEALYGRNKSDHGLRDYILSNSDLQKSDSDEVAIKKILSGIGIGFDGKQFIFARFISSTSKKEIPIDKLKLDFTKSLNIEFSYEIKNFTNGLKKLALLLKQRDKYSLTKQTLCSVLNPKEDFVRTSIFNIYKQLTSNIASNNRVKTLYKEWDRIFGTLYGNDADATSFTEVSSKIRELYGIEDKCEIDSKRYLFSMQTFFNIFLKLLVYSFLSQMVDPMFTLDQDLTKNEINSLFDGTSDNSCRLVNNFFESHFLEWFTFTANTENPDDSFDVKLVNSTLEKIKMFDLSTFVLKPENVQDILQEVYMGLIPSEMRHLMGEYFSPDWIVEHALDMVQYNGNIDKTLVDPTSGSGPFLTQAIKRIIKSKHGTLTRDDITKIVKNIIGFDINPISVVAAKTNYILIIFSAFFENCNEEFGEPISIPVFIADSILAPIVYSEDNNEILKLKTSVGDIELPKFDSFSKGNEFLKLLNQKIDDRTDYQIFENLVCGRRIIHEQDKPIVKKLFEKLHALHRAGQDSFWPIIFRNSFSPIMIQGKFDYVVGNPPWIAWKSMSKSYREGTLSIWQSYGIFDGKSSYDKKTTHDNFGMAVTYVAVDQYLKNGGNMVFLLPATFLKSTKGSEGFRKLEIVRNNQNIPFSIDIVHDFSDVNLFTVPTVAVKITKGKSMKYPMENYKCYTQIGGKKEIDSHASWENVSKILESHDYKAKHVDPNNKQSAWLILSNSDMSFADKVLNTNSEIYYQGRKGIEPAGAKGVYILQKPIREKEGYLRITNDISRQKRQDIKTKGAHTGVVEERYVYPMLGGRNISRWKVNSNEFMIVPHTKIHKYGVPVTDLAKESPYTYEWLNFYHDGLLKTRIQNGKFFNEATQPFYRLDNVGEYTYSPYKVLWKEQTKSMAAVVVSSYLKSIPNADKKLFSKDKIIVVDSKVLMLAVEEEKEAHYVCGIINAPCITNILDSYGVSTNRGIDILKNIAIEKFDIKNPLHLKIAELSKKIHNIMKKSTDISFISQLEIELDKEVKKLYS